MFPKHKLARNRVKKLFNHQTQIIKVVSYYIWNSQPRLAKNRSREAAFRTDLLYTVRQEYKLFMGVFRDRTWEELRRIGTARGSWSDHFPLSLVRSKQTFP